MASSAASSSSISVASNASSPGPSVSQRGSFRRTASSSTLGGSSPGPGTSRSRAFSNASSLTIGSTNAAPAHLRPFKARRSPVRPPTSGASNVLASTITENDVLQHVTRPDQVDLLALSDDSIPSLFVRFGVKDVRSIQDLARTQASSKQQELRNMVGERYRDLLGAADSIVRMRGSSRNLVDQLGHARKDCARDQMQRRTRSFSRQRIKPHSRAPSRADVETGPAHHSLAMLIKLLLDAPEHIWRALELQDCLSAARLAVLGRVVYRELASMSLSPDADDEEDENEESEVSDVFRAFPLVERQWDSLSQLASQIVRRAKTSLQRWDVPSETSAQTLVAILLLDNTPLDSLLEILLAQRQAALSDHLLDQQVTSASVQEITAHITQALGLITVTLDQATQLMQPDSLLLKTVEQLQSPNINTSEVEPSSLPSILNKLPNAHLLLRYLPATVTSFTPFIDTSSPPSASFVDNAISTWFETARDHFENALRKAAQAIPDAASLATFKRSIDSFLQTQKHLNHAATLCDFVQETLLKRLETIYQTSLDHLVQSTNTEWSAALAESSSSLLETNVSAYTLSDLPLPSATAFDALDQALQRRLDGRSPLLHQCLVFVERLCGRVKVDLQDWFGPDLVHGESAKHSHLEGYRQSLQSAFEALIAHFRTLMGQEHPPLLMLRLWLALYSDQQGFSQLASFDQTLDASHAAFQSELQALQEVAAQRWITSVSEAAVTSIREAMVTPRQRLTFEPDFFEVQSVEGTEVLVAARPTATMFQACLLLAQHAERLDTQVLAAKPDLPQSILHTFYDLWTETIQKSISQLDKAQTSALLWDCTFVHRLAPFKASQDWRDEAATKIGIPWSTFQDTADSSVQRFLVRTQNVFAALRAEQAQSSAEKASTLLPLGPPPSNGAGAQVVSGPTKLGARFGLLPVSSI